MVISLYIRDTNNNEHNNCYDNNTYFNNKEININIIKDIDIWPYHMLLINILLRALHLIEKRRGLSPGGRFPPSFIHQVIIIAGLNTLYNCMFSPWRWPQMPTGRKTPTPTPTQIHLLITPDETKLSSDVEGDDYRNRSVDKLEIDEGWVDVYFPLFRVTHKE